MCNENALSFPLTWWSTMAALTHVFITAFLISKMPEARITRLSQEGVAL